MIAVWREVRTWPAPSRLALASRILQSLEQEQFPGPTASPADLIGAWKSDRPPSDEEVERMLEEERMTKHG
ncbi:MAG TPA: hypothetical protein VIL46_15370 [Gemmataceae bacterium]